MIIKLPLMTATVTSTALGICISHIRFEWWRAWVSFLATLGFFSPLWSRLASEQVVYDAIYSKNSLIRSWQGIRISYALSYVLITRQRQMGNYRLNKKKKHRQFSPKHTCRQVLFATRHQNCDFHLPPWQPWNNDGILKLNAGAAPAQRALASLVATIRATLHTT